MFSCCAKKQGWIDGIAILIAVLIVAFVSATNDYTKELQFRALEKTSEETNRSLVLRDGNTSLVRDGKQKTHESNEATHSGVIGVPPLC